MFNGISTPFAPLRSLSDQYSSERYEPELWVKLYVLYSIAMALALNNPRRLIYLETKLKMSFATIHIKILISIYLYRRMDKQERISTHTHTHTHTHIYIYIYIERERERNIVRERYIETDYSLMLREYQLLGYIYIYIYSVRKWFGRSGFNPRSSHTKNPQNST